MNIYIGSLAPELNEEHLKTAFEAFGFVEKAAIIKDKFTGESRGFGFVEMPNRTEAEAAMRGITEIEGKRVNVNEARPQEKKSFGPAKYGAGKKSGRGSKPGRRRQY